MKNLSELGFVFDSSMGMFSAKNLEHVSALIGEVIYFTYSDADNGSISGSGIINSINPHDVQSNGEGIYSVDFDLHSGSSFIEFKYYKDAKFSDGDKFIGGIFAGDDLDSVLFKLSHE